MACVPDRSRDRRSVRAPRLRPARGRHLVRFASARRRSVLEEVASPPGHAVGLSAARVKRRGGRRARRPRGAGAPRRRADPVRRTRPPRPGAPVPGPPRSPAHLAPRAGAAAPPWCPRPLPHRRSGRSIAAARSRAMGTASALSSAAMAERSAATAVRSRVASTPLRAPRRRSRRSVASDIGRSP